MFLGKNSFFLNKPEQTRLEKLARRGDLKREIDELDDQLAKL